SLISNVWDLMRSRKYADTSSLIILRNGSD
ncbi:unnamed protein product, partial [marine sediment metagenome]